MTDNDRIELEALKAELLTVIHCNNRPEENAVGIIARIRALKEEPEAKAKQVLMTAIGCDLDTPIDVLAHVAVSHMEWLRHEIERLNAEVARLKTEPEAQIHGGLRGAIEAQGEKLKQEAPKRKGKWFGREYRNGAYGGCLCTDDSIAMYYNNVQMHRDAPGMPIALEAAVDALEREARDA